MDTSSSLPGTAGSTSGCVPRSGDPSSPETPGSAPTRSASPTARSWSASWKKTLAADSVAQWCTALEAHEVPIATILDINEVYAHPHTDALEIVRSVVHSVAGPIPYRPLGQHTAEVLTELGVDEAAQAALRAGTVHRRCDRTPRVTHTRLKQPVRKEISSWDSPS